MAAHGLEHLEGAGEVVIVVLQRLGDTLADSLEPGEVDDGINVSEALEELLHLVGVSQLGLDEGDAPADNVLHAVDGFLAGIAEVVGDNDVIARLDELNTGMAADVPGAAGNENGHENRSFNSIKPGSLPASGIVYAAHAKRNRRYYKLFALSSGEPAGNSSSILTLWAYSLGDMPVS